MNKKIIWGVLVIVFFVGGGVLLRYSGWQSGFLKETPKVYRIGVLNGLGLFAPTVDGLKQRMTELGYREGENITYEIYQTNFELEKEKQILKKFVDEKVDLIVSSPTEVSQEAKRAIAGTNIPLVFVNAFTEGSGLVESVSYPGGNVTGVRFPGPELILLNLETLHEIVPQAKRIYVPYDPNYPASQLILDRLRPAAVALHLTLVEVQVTSFEELDAELAKRSLLKDPGVDAIITMANTITASPRGTAAIGRFALAHKIPYESTVSSDNPSGLFFIIPDPFEAGTQAAGFVDKILRGIPAGTISVTSQEAYLSINYKVAQSLGITISEGLLARAKRVIH